MTETIGILITTNGAHSMSPWMKDRVMCQSVGRDRIRVIIVDSGFQNTRHAWDWADSYIHVPGQSVGVCRWIGIQEGFRLNVSIFAFWKETYYYRWNYLEQSIKHIGTIVQLPFPVRPIDAVLQGSCPLLTLSSKTITRSSNQDYMDYSFVVSASYFLQNPQKLKEIQVAPLLDVFSRDVCSIMGGAFHNMVAIEPYDMKGGGKVVIPDEAYFHVIEVLRFGAKHPLITFTEEALCL